MRASRRTRCKPLRTLLVQSGRYGTGAISLRQFERVPGIALCNRQTLQLVTVEQSAVRMTLAHGSEFPTEVESVLHAGIETESAGGCKQMHRVAKQKTSPFAKALGDESDACAPFGARNDLMREGFTDDCL